MHNKTQKQSRQYYVVKPSGTKYVPSALQLDKSLKGGQLTLEGGGQGKNTNYWAIFSGVRRHVERGCQRLLKVTAQVYLCFQQQRCG